MAQHVFGGASLPLAVQIVLGFARTSRKPFQAQYFQQLHIENLKLFESRLLERVGGAQPMTDIEHQELHNLLHMYCQALVDVEKMEMWPLHSRQEENPGIRIINIGPMDPSALTKTISTAGEVVAAFAFAFAGGLSLLVPMLIMVYNPSRTATVITTCVFVFVFALSLALYSVVMTSLKNNWKALAELVVGLNLQPKDILAATAAYAAVLVVFVGASTRSGSGSGSSG